MGIIQRTNSLTVKRRAQREKVVVTDYSLTAREPWITVSTCLRIFVLVFFLGICLLIRGVIQMRARKVSEMRILVPYGLPKDRNITFAGSKRKGVSLVAACQNGHEQLRTAFRTWVNIHDVNEILIIDWSSTPALKLVIEEVHIPFTNPPAVRVIRVENQRHWKASWAFNLAFSLMHYENVLKINCDHSVETHFIESHQLESNSFYAGGEHLERSNDDVDLRNVLYISAKHLRAVGGFDERLQEYGGEQEDLVSRLLFIGLNVTDPNYDAVSHKLQDHERKASGESHYTMEQLEKKVNMRLIKHLPRWNISEFTDDVAHSEHFLHSVMSFQHSNVQYISINVTSHQQSVRFLVDKSHIFREREHVSSSYLSDEHQIPSCISNALVQYSRMGIIKALEENKHRESYHSTPRTIWLYMKGSIVTQFHIFLSALSLSRASGKILILLMSSSSAKEKSLFQDIKYKEHRNVLVADIQDLSSFLSGHACGYRKASNAVKHFKFTSKGGNTKVILEDMEDKHFLIETEIPLAARDLRSVNVKTMYEEFRNLLFYRDVNERLKVMEKQGIQGALGIHVSADSALGTNSSAKLHVFSSVSAQLKSWRDMGENFGVFLDGADEIREPLKEDGAEFIDIPEVNSGSCFVVRDCVYRDILRSIALSKTRTLMKFGDDDITGLVDIIRGK